MVRGKTESKSGSVETEREPLIVTGSVPFPRSLGCETVCESTISLLPSVNRVFKSQVQLASPSRDEGVGGGWRRWKRNRDRGGKRAAGGGYEEVQRSANKPAGKCALGRIASPRRLSAAVGRRKHRSLDTHNQIITDDAGTSSGAFHLPAITPIDTHGAF